MISLSHWFLTLVRVEVEEVLQTLLRIQWKRWILFSGKYLRHTQTHKQFCVYFQRFHASQLKTSYLYLSTD